MNLGAWPEVRMRKRKRILLELLTAGSQFHSPAFKGRVGSLPLGSTKHSQITTVNPLVWLKLAQIEGLWGFLFGFWFWFCFFTYNQESPK